MNLLDMLFLKNTEVDMSILAENLFYSLDDYSNFGNKGNFLYRTKLYEEYSKLEYITKNLGEKHKEIKAIIKANDKSYFIRIVIDDRDLIYDILIYSITNEIDYAKYKRIFFTGNEIALDDYLNSIKDTIAAVENNTLLLIKNENSFLVNLGFEDWDFKNKHNNDLNSVIKENISKYIINKEAIKGSFTFIKNGNDKIMLNIEFTPYSFNDKLFYIIK